MSELNIRQMFEAGVHFGHQARFWNPKMAPYIYGERNKIHIINLDTSLPLLKSALSYLQSLGASGSKVLFVGTKRVAGEPIEKHARRCGMPYVNHRWLGGMLTNFKTIRLSIKRYSELEEERKKDGATILSKKQALCRDREITKLSRNLEGIRDMKRLPDAMFIIDVGHEKIAVQEAVKLGIPVVAVVDTNGSFEGVDYVVPGNDDAISAIDLYTSYASDAILRGIEIKNTEAVAVASEMKKDVKGVIKMPSKSASGKKALERKEKKFAGDKEQSKPKVRMRGFTGKIKETLASSEQDKDKSSNAAVDTDTDDN